MNVRNYKADTISGHLNNSCKTSSLPGGHPLDKVEKMLKLKAFLDFLAKPLKRTLDGRIDTSDTFANRGTVVTWNPKHHEEKSIEELKNKFDRPEEVQVYYSLAGPIIIHKDDLAYVQYRERELPVVAQDLGFNDHLDPKLLSNIAKVVEVRAECLRRAEKRFGPFVRRNQKSQSSEPPKDG